MRKTTAIAAVLVLACVSARADELIIKGLTYGNARILSVTGGEVTFVVLPGRSEVTKLLQDVNKITLTSKATFTEAENLLSAGKAAEAAEKYRQAAKSATGWLTTLIRYRRLAALDKAALIDESAREWLALADEAVESGAGLAGVLDLRPTGMPKGRSPRNQKAIDLLEAKLKAVADRAEYVRAVRQLLMDLHQRQGNNDRAAALAKLLASTAAPTPTPATGSTTAVAPVGPDTVRMGASYEGQLRAVGVLLEQGNATEAAKTLTANLHRYNDNELPTALLLLGRAQLALFQKTDGNDVVLLKKAGVNFMRVAAFYPTADEAAEALYQAGRVNTMLPTPNLAAARNAYQRVVARHGQTPAGEKARQALASLETR